MAVGDAGGQNWAEASEIAREKSERLRGNERGLGGKAEEPVTDCGGREGRKCVRQTAERRGRNRERETGGEGVICKP